MQTKIRFANNGVIAEERILARYMTDKLLPNHPNGGTYDPWTDRFPTFNDEMTYLVSVPGYEYRIRETPSADRLLSWLSRVRRPLSVRQHYLGWWRDGRQWVFDISVALNGSRAFILGLAESWGQKAIYHPASADVVYVPSQLERAA